MHKISKEFGFYFMQILELVLIFLGLTHIFACSFMWYCYYLHFNSSWTIPLEMIHNHSIVHQYIYCIYRVISILTGSDSIAPTNTLENIFLILLNLISVFLLSVIIGNISDVVQQLNKRSQLFREKMNQVKFFCTNRGVDPLLSNKIVNHTVNWWNRRAGIDDNEVISHLPPILKKELVNMLNQELILKCNLFSNCTEHFTTSLISYLVPHVYNHLDYIIIEGEIGNEMYFINRGQCKVLVNNHPISILKQGQYFGEIALIQSNAIRTASVQALHFTDCLILNRDDFLNLNSKYPKEISKIKNQANKRQIKSKIYNLLKQNFFKNNEELVELITKKFYEIKVPPKSSSDQHLIFSSR